MKTKPEKLLLMALLIAVAVLFTWLASTLPIHVDEALTHQHFCSQGWKIAISTYPFPNNHVFFSLLGAVAVMLPLKPIFAMRLVSVGAALVSLVMVYKIIRLRTRVINSLFGALFWVVTLGGAYYGMHARGYGLQVMFLLLGLYLVEQWNSRNGSSSLFKFNSKKGIALVVFSALGFFTIPTFLFPFSSILLLLILYGSQRGCWRQQLAHVFLIGGATAVLTTLFYAPLFYYMGIDALIDNQWVRERDFAIVGTRGITLFLTDISAYGGYVTLVFALGLIVWRLIQGKYRSTYLIAAFLLVPVVFMFIMHSVPFSRTFVYLIAISVVFIFTAIPFNGGRNTKYIGHVLFFVSILMSGLFTYRGIQPALTKGSVDAEDIQRELQTCCDDRILYSHKWNECAQMIDYFTWRNGVGPRVKYLYKDDFWASFKDEGGSLCLRLRDDEVPNRCGLLLKKGKISVYDCY